MKKILACLLFMFLTAALLFLAYAICATILHFTRIDNDAPVVFVLAVVVISRITYHMYYGIVASIVSTFAINYFFTYPYHFFTLSIVGYPIDFVCFTMVTLQAARPLSGPAECCWCAGWPARLSSSPRKTILTACCAHRARKHSNASANRPRKGLHSVFPLCVQGLHVKVWNGRAPFCRKWKYPNFSIDSLLNLPPDWDSQNLSCAVPYSAADRAAVTITLGRRRNRRAKCHATGKS